MDPIDGLSKLTRLLQQRVRKEAASKTHWRAASTSATVASERKSIATLEGELRLRIKLLRQQHAGDDVVGQTVVGILLAWEFSERLCSEPKFDALVQQVHQRIAGDVRLDAMLREIIRGL